MQDATNPPLRLRLAVATGVASSQLSTLLARQRAEEPEVTLALFEVASDDLLEGLREGRYDAGVSLHGGGDPAVKTQLLWTEIMAVAMPPQFCSINQSMLTIDDLKDYPVYRWHAEKCPLLDAKLVSFGSAGQESVQWVSSFEMLALWVAAGYGVGVSVQSRIERAREWGINMRPFADGPYKVATYLQRLHTQADSVFERFERRACQLTKAGAT